MKLLRILFTGVIAYLSVPTLSSAASGSNANALKIATWNVEHLAFPVTEGCRPRSPEEIEKLQNYATSLNADIVALQEVSSVKAVQQLFPAKQWEIYLSERADSEPYTCRESGYTSTQQKVAFAVRKALKVKSVSDFAELGLAKDGLRHGLEMVVESPLGEMTLLNVHLKSGCFVDNHSRAKSNACKAFSKQAPILDNWVEEKEKQQQPYVVLGDFNHRLSAPYNHLTQALSNNANQLPSSLQNTTKDLIGCHPYYPAPIDHILVGHMNKPTILKKAKVHHYQNMDPKAMLSDHCAMSLQISDQPLPLTSAVEWQTASAEYRFLTQSIYNEAASHLNKLASLKDAWVVVMDVDETILDNSAYQVNIDKSGDTFTPKSWDDWVISEKATLVPGAKGFIEKVIQNGGKLAFITNRARHLDKHTWKNLKAMGIPVSVENTCLMGRAKQDKSAIDHKTIKNDKDLRRQQISNGTASCFHPESGRHSGFSKQKIAMQVGDNIEDFAGVVQEDADIKALTKPSAWHLILLPNPMYGSW